MKNVVTMSTVKYQFTFSGEYFIVFIIFLKKYIYILQTLDAIMITSLLHLGFFTIIYFLMGDSPVAFF